ncbi:MAG: hypothetical protein HQL53_02020 [Magnetococcales bacterium]|nr:hypothetical protein [Magnetococcales bacterium]
MGRLVVSLVLAILMLAFASQNMHETKVRLIFGPAVEAPMILIVSLAFVTGFAVAIFAFLVRGPKKSQYEDEY